MSARRSTRLRRFLAWEAAVRLYVRMLSHQATERDRHRAEIAMAYFARRFEPQRWPRGCRWRPGRHRWNKGVTTFGGPR